MKNQVYLLCIAFCLGLAFTTQAQWETVASLPSSAEARHHPCTFSIGNYGYVVTGGNDEGYLDDCYRYDPSEDSWQRMNDFPGGVRGFGIGVSYNFKAYIGFGGNDFETFGDLWEYDPEMDMWTELADFPGQPRYHPAMVAVNDKIYVGLGNGFAGNLKDWWEYDILEDSWEKMPDFPGDQRHHPFQFAIGDYAYVGMGHGPSIYNDLYRFDPVTDEWTAMTNLPGEGRVAGTQFDYNGKGYVLSGQGMDHNYMEDGEFWEYDPESDSWTQLESHPGRGSRWAPGSFLIDGTVYFMAGEEARINKSDMMKYELKVVSSNEELSSEYFTVRPNPVSDFLMINQDYRDDYYEIFDFQGKNIQSGILDMDQLSIAHLNTASYVLKIYHDDEVMIGPFIKK